METTVLTKLLLQSEHQSSQKCYFWLQMAGERELSELLLFSAEGLGANERTGFAALFISRLGALSRYFVKWNDLLSSQLAIQV